MRIRPGYRKACFALLVGMGVCRLSPAAAPIVNPLFNGGDPWVTFDNGVYYYSASYCSLATICLKASPTLSGLAATGWVGVWNAPASGPNSKDVWAPEIHKVDGKWYIYYAADDGNNNNHRIFVLQAQTDDPLRSWAAADTGRPNGQLIESSGRWAIDPDVFTAHDGKLYIVWSCTNYANSTFPQATCIAPMRDALHTSGPTSQISTPTESWETRTAPIQEGPVGFVRDGRTYITYSASASWTVNDYSVGVLINADDRILNPGSWIKYGPIFDHHGTAYGTGSVVFIASPDGREMWNLYHGIDRLDCNPSYTCRDIRMQKMSWTSDGNPLLGYPLNPGVPAGIPSGEPGVEPTPLSPSSWGPAFGDAAIGNQDAGNVVGDWSTDTWPIVNNTLGAAWNRIFSMSNPNLENYTLAVDLKMIQAGGSSQSPKYGVYAAYSDIGNYVSVWLDAKNNALATYAVVNGVAQPWANCDLPSGFDASVFNHLEVRKKGPLFSISLNGTPMTGACGDRSFNLLNGQIGLVTEDTLAAYNNVRVIATGPVFTTTSVVNSATSLNGGIAPGEIVTIFGSGLGPLYGAGAAGLPQLSLNGVQVFFDGSPAPVFYASNDQINVQAPNEISGKARTMVAVSYAGAASNWIPVDVAGVDPGIYAIVNNDDGTLNSSASPVTRGSAIIVYGTGQGVVDPPVPTGQPAAFDPLSQVKGLSATIGGVSAPVLFAGLAPGYVGLMQVNLVVPLETPAGAQQIEIVIGDARTTFPLWVK